MSSRQVAIDLVRQWFTYCNAHDIEGIVSLCAEYATWSDSGVPLVRKGKEAIAKSLRYSFGAFRDWRFEYRIVLADERTVVIELDNTATWTGAYLRQQPTGKKMAFSEAGIFEIAEGKVQAYRGYLDMHDWADQIDLKLPF